MKANKKRKGKASEMPENSAENTADVTVQTADEEKADASADSKSEKKPADGKKTANKKGSKKFSTLLIIVVLIAGLSLLLYPTISNYVNSLHSSKAIAEYESVISGMSDAEYDKLMNEAKNFNRRLAERDNTFFLSDEQMKEYLTLLDITGTGVMGYIEIPSINVSIPIYHTTSEAVLQVAVGHLEWSSLPVGGINTHSVLSGHRGLPSAKLFTDLDELTVGDYFLLRVLNEDFTYEIDQILIVDPDNTESLGIIEGGDYCTLVTCTPYGINSHRLLVRGHRIENFEAEKVVRVTADAVQIEPMIVAPIIAIPILLVLMVVLMIKPKKKRSSQHSFESDLL